MELESYSLAALLFAALMLCIVLILVRRRHQRYQKQFTTRTPEAQDFQQIELIRVQNPSEQDLKAYNLIESERQKVWRSLSTNTSIAPRRIYQLSFDLIQQIAAIYHPEKENPVFQASIFDLLELNYRIIERVKDYLEDSPLSPIKDLNVEEILRYKGYVDQLTNFQVVKFAQQHEYLYTIWKYAWMGYNALNPWYWGRRLVYTAGKEGAFRYLLNVIITIAGEEAVLVYSKRNIRAKAAAIEKNIAFEMINMAVTDGVISQEEYEIILDFILNNSRLDNQMKVSLLKALARKHALKTTLPLDAYDEKDKKRLLVEVERVAKADTLGLLKKREALKAMEDSLALPSPYRAKLELTPHAEVQSWELMQHNRRREEAILRLMVQAGTLTGPIPESLREYILQRAASYPLPFNDEEQQALFTEITTPTPKDTLTDLIRTRPDKERALSDILDALLWDLPFSRPKEEFYTLIVSALDMKNPGETVLIRRFGQRLPQGNLIEKPPADLLKYLYRLLVQDEQVLALQHTGTKYRFMPEGEQRKAKDVDCWLCVTSQRVLVLAVAKIDMTMYQHVVEFGKELRVQKQPGRLVDTYILRGNTVDVHLENALFRSAYLQHALQAFFPPELPANTQKS